MNNLSNAEIQELLNLIAQKNDKAFKTLYDAYQKPLSHFVFRKIWGRSSSATEEIVNDTFMEIWKNPHRFDANCKFSTWLCLIASRNATDWLRKEKVVFDDEIESEDFLEFPDLETDILFGIENKEKHEVLLQCLNKLPSAQQTVVELFYLNDETQIAIANVLSIPLGTVKSRLSNAVPKISECVKRAFGLGK